MSSFAATVFIAGLVTVGVSLMALLIALTVMLQNCHRHNAGVIEMQKPADDFDYCRILALHIELNHLDSDSFPLVCKELAVQLIEDGQYARELNVTLRVVENYFSSIKPGEGGRDVVLMDADDLFPSDYFALDQMHRYLFSFLASQSSFVFSHACQFALQGDLKLSITEVPWSFSVITSRVLCPSSSM